MGFGDYPAEYNPKIHGIYDPARFYGKGECRVDENQHQVFGLLLKVNSGRLCNKFFQ